MTATASFSIDIKFAHSMTSTSSVLFAGLLALLMAVPVSAVPAGPLWTTDLAARLQAIDDQLDGEIGVYVQALDGSGSVSWRADESWYLASGIKVMVAIAVLRAVESGEFGLDTALTLQASDYVDGAGHTNRRPPGSELSIGWLLEQMILDSDNTATDLLIGRVGLDRINAVALELMPECGAITTLADVRRQTYAGLHPKAAGLVADDLLALRSLRGEARLRGLAERLGVPRSEFRLATLDAAFDAFYATRANSGTLEAYGRMLAALHRGEALGPEGTRHLLGLMQQVRTGARRLKAGLPPDSVLAHKTGTQHRRACDLGIVEHAGRGLVIAACARGAPKLAASERALRAVAEAVVAAGALEQASMPPTAP